jgi:DMSO reductase family type II enzyme chaperone
MKNGISSAAQERAAGRALARAALYRLLSQSFAFPAGETVEALRGDDLPQALELSASLPPRPSAALAAFAREAGLDAQALQMEHRRIFSHVMTADCPPCETVYTAHHIFEETSELSDLAGFYRAFGLELVERERPDHVSVELEFMHLLTFKEAYARAYHSEAKVRLCRSAQRAFVRDHLGRWASRFASLLSNKAGGGYYGALAGLLQAFVESEIALLRVTPEPATAAPDRLRGEQPADDGCPYAETCVVGGVP